MSSIISMYISLTPVIVSGILTMIVCKLRIFNGLNKPIDRGLILRDKRRLFGDNKTYKGFLSYILVTGIINVFWGVLAYLFPLLESYNYFYVNHENTLVYNLFVGLLLGLAYGLFELPNSFIKRRLNIEPGKSLHGFLKGFFVFMDQADSIFGCALVIWIFNDIGLVLYISIVLVGAGTHILLNMLLYTLGLRKNRF